MRGRGACGSCVCANMRTIGYCVSSLPPPCLPLPCHLLVCMHIWLCVHAYVSAVGPSVQVTINCTRPSDGWPPTFNVVVSGTAAPPCGSTASSTTAVTSPPVPTVNITGPDTATICARSSPTMFTYRVVSTRTPVENLTVTVTSTYGVTCTPFPTIGEKPIYGT